MVVILTDTIGSLQEPTLEMFVVLGVVVQILAQLHLTIGDLKADGQIHCIIHVRQVLVVDQYLVQDQDPDQAPEVDHPGQVQGLEQDHEVLEHLSRTGLGR